MHAPASTLSYLRPADSIDEIEIEIPELEDAILLGEAVAIVYRDPDGVEFVHEFKPGAQLLVDDGVIVVVDPHLTVDELGLED